MQLDCLVRLHGSKQSKYDELIRATVDIDHHGTGALGHVIIGCPVLLVSLGLCTIIKMGRRKRKEELVHLPHVTSGSGATSGEWHWPVIIWIPNLLTYIRIVACAKAFLVAFTDKKQFTVLYSVCFVCNELSRHITHFMNCSSTIGDIISHVSSRASNTALLIVLSHLYRRDYRVFILLLELDIVSHWFRIYCEVMSMRCPCLHLCNFQNALYRHPVFWLLCAASQEVVYITLYLVAFDWMEHGHPVKLDKKSFHRIFLSQYFRSLAMAAPGYVIRQLTTLDEIRLATQMCIHFDHQNHCHYRPPPEPPESPEPPVIICEVQPKPRRRRSRSRPRGRKRSRSKLKFELCDYY